MMTHDPLILAIRFVCYAVVLGMLLGMTAITIIDIVAR